MPATIHVLMSALTGGIFLSGRSAQSSIKRWPSSSSPATTARHTARPLCLTSSLRLDLASREQTDAARSVVRALNADARIEEVPNGRVPLAQVLNTGYFSFADARRHPTGLKELFGYGGHVSEAEQYGIRIFVYRARAPFAPQNFHDFATQRQ